MVDAGDSLSFLAQYPLHLFSASFQPQVPALFISGFQGITLKCSSS